MRPDCSRYRGMARGSHNDRGGFWLPVDRSRPVVAILVESAIDDLSAWLLHPRLRTSGTVFVSTAGTTHRSSGRGNLDSLLRKISDQGDCQ